MDERPKNYHSIIYLDDEVNHGKFRTKRSVDKNDFHSEADHGCGLSSEVKAQMEEVQNSAEFTSHAQSTKYNEPIKRKSHLFMDHNEFNFGNGTKRDKRDLRFQSTKEINGHHLFSVRTCSIYLQADQKLYMQIFMKEGNRDHVRFVLYKRIKFSFLLFILGQEKKLSVYSTIILKLSTIFMKRLILVVFLA